VKTIALTVETHRAINEKNANKGSFLHQYLINQLGLKDGVETEINKKWIIKYIADGGEYEDKPSECIPYWRSRNHFHNPINNSGFSGIWDTGLLSGISAIAWAMQPVSSQSCGYYSWNDARDYYYNALTSTSKATRETNFADTFRAIGQSMHMVQDMSVPEHTRNNGHYFFSYYESWAKDLNISDFSAIPFTPSAAFPLSINNLFDTDQYSGTNPCITVQSTIGLAEYSNANFLSPDTIFTGFDYPAYSDTAARIEPDPATGENILYLDKVANGANINYFARARRFYNYLPADYKKLALTLNDEKVYANYASLLIPRSIGYSSQVLSYFFRGKLDVEMVQEGLKVKNISDETISGGTFKLYYDNADGERNLLTSTTANTLAPGGDPQTITFDPPVGAASYVLVFQGQLGNEPGAVIGKYAIRADSFYLRCTFNGHTATQGGELIKLTDGVTTESQYVQAGGLCGPFTMPLSGVTYPYVHYLNAYTNQSIHAIYQEVATLAEATNAFSYQCSEEYPTWVEDIFSFKFSNSNYNLLDNFLMYAKRIDYRKHSTPVLSCTKSVEVISGKSCPVYAVNFTGLKMIYHELLQLKDFPAYQGNCAGCSLMAITPVVRAYSYLTTINSSSDVFRLNTAGAGSLVCPGTYGGGGGCPNQYGACWGVDCITSVSPNTWPVTKNQVCILGDENDSSGTFVDFNFYTGMFFIFFGQGCCDGGGGPYACVDERFWEVNTDRYTHTMVDAPASFF
jgi:hypothetical protein